MNTITAEYTENRTDPIDEQKEHIQTLQRMIEEISSRRDWSAG